VEISWTDRVKNEVMKKDTKRKGISYIE
jgi:hypothetical protein